MDHAHRWEVNEGLLQSYRSMFVSSQSFLLAFGAIVSERSSFLTMLIVVVGFYMIYGLWKPVVESRRLEVDFHKGQMDDSSIDPGCDLREYKDDEKKREHANKVFGFATNKRSTRIKLDHMIPCIFALLWLALLAFSLKPAQT